MPRFRLACALGLAATTFLPAAIAQKPPASSKLKDGLAPTKAKEFKPPALKPADLLATGDQRVLVKWSDGTKNDYWLVRLEKTWAILRDRPKGEPTLTTAESGKIAEIVTDNKKFTWKLAADRKSFEGKVQESPATEKLSIDPKPADRRVVEQFLLLSFRRMANRALDGLASTPSPSDVAEVRAIAASRSEAIRKSGLAKSIAGLYAALPGVLDIVAEQVAVQDRLISEYNEKIKVQDAERRKIAERRAMAATMGMVKMFLGAMPDQQVVRPLFGSPIIVDRGPVNPEMVAGGMRDIAGAAAIGAPQLEMLDNIKKLMDRKQQEAMAASLYKQSKATDGLRAQFEELASGEFSLPKFVPIPPEEWARPRKTRANYQPLIDRLGAACERDRAGLSRSNPFAQLDLLFFQSVVPGLTKSDQHEVWQSQARDAIQLAAEMPSDPILDHDRAEALAIAAELALRAAEGELGPDRWADSYHPRAIFALNVLDLALKYAPDDPSGRFREQKAQALLMSGQVADALKLAREVEEIRGQMPRYRFQLARIECAAGEVDRGLDNLEDAIVKQAFPDVHEARKRGGDFPQGEPRFRDITEIRLRVDGKVPNGFQATGPRFVVTNLSKFPLTDVGISVQCSKIIRPATSTKPAVTENIPYFQSFARIEPNETVVISPGKVGRIKTLSDGTIDGKLQLASRQGVTEILHAKK